MRRKRQRLQINTFPFMAVLLCALGSLILLLLVFDRRAKIVAEAKALKESQGIQAQEDAERRKLLAQQAEWERRKQELHNLLLSQRQQVLTQLGQVHKQQQQVQGQIVALESDAAAVLQNLTAEKAALERLQIVVQGKQDRLAKAGNESEQSQKSLALLAEELVQLEGVLQGLKALRLQNQRTYSVVPYSGKRGEDRKPIYAECTGNGVIFQPDGVRLDDAAFAPMSIRRELDRRIKVHLAKATGGAKAEKPYLFVLVRPDGLQSYYAVQTALSGLYIDFGYELIDQDWVLDFTGDSMKLPKSAPIIAAAPEKIEGAKSVQGYKLKGFAPGAAAPATGQYTAAGQPGGVAQPGAWSAGVGGAPGAAGQAENAKWKPARPGGAFPRADGAGPGVGLFPGLAGTAVAGGEVPKLGDGPGAGAGGGPFPGGGTGIPPGAGGGNLAGTQPGPGLPVTLPGNTPGLPGGGSGPSGTGPGGVPNLPLPGVPQGQQTPAYGAGTGGNGPQAPPSSAGAGGATSGSAQSGAASGAPGGPSQSGGAGAGTGASSPSGGTGQGGGVSLGSPQGTGSGDDGGEVDPALKGFTFGGESPDGKVPPRRSPSPLGKLLGNRDWYVPIECRAEGVVLPLSHERYTVAELVQQRSGVNSLARSIQKTIDRRQAAVRPGEPPYRVILRFEVYPDGLAAYHRAFPLLEGLNLPTSRRDVGIAEPDLSDYYRK